MSSGSFTPVTSWPLGAQDLTCANEIIMSYFQHRTVLGQAPSGYSYLSLGDNAQRILNDPAWGGDGQGKNVFQEIQEWLEQYCVEFVDTTGGDSFYNDDKTGFRKYTKTTWQEAADLNVSDEPYYSFTRRQNLSDRGLFGKYHPGDIRGPWCFKELQRGLSKLEWTYVGGSSVYPVEVRKWITPWEHFRYYEISGEGYPTLAEMRAQFVAAFEASDWTAASGNGGYKVSAYDGPGSGWGWKFDCERVKSVQTLNLPAIPRTIDTYMMTTGDGVWTNFDEVAGLSAGTQNEYAYLTDFSNLYSEGTTVIINNIASSNAWCPLTLWGDAGGNGVIRSNNYVLYMLRWDFTYNTYVG